MNGGTISGNQGGGIFVTRVGSNGNTTFRYTAGNISGVVGSSGIEVLKGVNYAYGADATPRALPVGITMVEGLRKPPF